MIWEINYSVSKFLSEFVLKNNLQAFVWIFADLPIFFIPIFLVIAWLYYTFKEKNIDRKKDLILIFLIPIIWIIINLIIQQVIHIPRPETYIKPILSHIPDASFPSDHAVVSFWFLFSLYLFGYKKTFWIYLPFVILMNLSRIAGGVHWFWDIIVGMVIALIVSVLIWRYKNSKVLKSISEFFVKLASYFKL